MRHKLLIYKLLCFFSLGLYAQVPHTHTSSEILHELQKLRVLGSVLYVAAHPDDENTRLIAWLSNHKQYRTGYLSLTRGDGGQNLIGDEQGVELGLIRTQELLAARRIDGGEQFFTSAFDFGFSKSPQETFTKWDHEKVLNDAVWIVRKFQPDVVVARFPEDSRAGHGHHSASGIIAREVFEAAADPNRFPEHLKYGLKPWQVKRVLWNTFSFGAGANTIDSTQFSVEVGDYSPLLGTSMGELAGESRSQHKSQGFGVSRQRGSAREFFNTIKGDRPVNDLLDGVDVTWERLPGGRQVGPLVDELIRTFNHANPAASLPMLKKVITAVQSMEASVWRDVKLEALQDLVLKCAGIYVEATVQKPEIITNDTVNIAVNIVNRSNATVVLNGLMAGNSGLSPQRLLQPNRMFNTILKTQFGWGVMETQPYWLREAQANGLYQVADQQLIGLAENPPLAVSVSMVVDSIFINLRQPIQYRYVDPVKAEQYQPAYITNRFLLFNAPGVLLFRKDQADSATIQVNITGTTAAVAESPVVRIASQSGKLKQAVQKGTIQWNGGDLYSITQRIPNYLKGTAVETDLIDISFKPGGKYGDAEFSNARRSIAYDHIPTQTWHYRDQIKVLHIDLKTAGKKIGYLPGAGDKVSAMLVQMGYEVKELKESDLTAANLKQFDAVVTGVRAYNVHDYLAGRYEDLMQYVKEGGNLIVQYNTSNFISQLKGKMAPYPITISRTRITDENAKVNFLLPGHPALNYPNKLTARDFEGWVQERSIYHADGLEAGKWQLPIAFADPGEKEEAGSLAIAPYGKGNFVYTGLVFFRQLPAGVPGAFRLMANLIALPDRGK